MKKAKSLWKELLVWMGVGCLLFSLTACSSKETEKETKFFSESYVATSIEEMCRDFPTIVRGSFCAIGDAVDPPLELPDGQIRYGSAIRTEYFIQVDEVFKGTIPENGQISCWVLGGETDQYISLPMGGSMPEVGEEWFFFIDPEGFYYPCGKVLEGDQVAVSESLAPELYNDSDTAAGKYVSTDEFAELIRTHMLSFQ